MSSSKQLILKASRAPDGRARIESLIGDEQVVVDLVDLWSDDDRDRLAGKINDLVPALELITIQRELLKIDRDNLPVVAGATDPWPDPVPVERPKVPAFLVDVLPDPLRSWVGAVSESCQVPADLPGLLGLAVCAGAVARRVEIMSGDGWIEPINLYTATLLDPANRKSSVFRSALEPLRSIEKELVEEAAPKHARLAADRRIKESQLKSAEKKAAAGDGESLHEARRLAEELSTEPVASLPKLIVDDATAEAVEIQLAAQGGRLVVAGCEGGLFDVMAGRYSSGVGNLDCFLKGHAGDDLRVDRVTRGSVVVDRCCLTLAYSVQPEVIRGMADKPSFRGRGLIGRFLYAVPESRIGSRRIDAGSVPTSVSDAYEALIRRLAAITNNFDGGANLVTMAPDAMLRFQDWQREVELMLGDRGRLSSMTDWGGKLCGLTARLAAIMHLVKTDQHDPWAVQVSMSTIVSAIELARWSIAHAEAVIAMMIGSDGPVDDAAYVLRWLRECGKPDFSRRDAQNHGRQRFDDRPARLDDALETLVDRNWIRMIPPPPPVPGRPPSPRYVINPKILARSEPKPVAKEPPARKTVVI